MIGSSSNSDNDCSLDRLVRSPSLLRGGLVPNRSSSRQGVVVGRGTLTLGVPSSSSFVPTAGVQKSLVVARTSAFLQLFFNSTVLQKVLLSLSAHPGTPKCGKVCSQAERKRRSGSRSALFGTQIWR